ncbi:MAG: VOC family protein [Candidatus Moraniibacteriota bacterium]|nr:MAG: VOC family protein [Candidatus Moranbacteria bacterium]
MRIHELGHVVLYVSNLERSRRFYGKTLGFHEIPADQPGMALFSSGRTHHELLLIEIDAVPREKLRPEPGLYHIGFKIGTTDDELMQAYAELEQAGVTIKGTADHHVTHSLYILDPDDNELELYVDISDEWKTNPSAVARPTKRLEL